MNLEYSAVPRAAQASGGLRVAHEGLRPFGALIEAGPGEHLRDRPPHELVALTRREHLLVLRGFASDPGPEPFVEFVAGLGDIQMWGEQNIFDVKAVEEPTDLVFETGFLPIHWDGMYHREPEFQVFQCVKAVAGQGGATLFSDTLRLLADTDRATQELWKRLTLRYERPEPDGTTIVRHPLVDAHPRGGPPRLRFSEPVPKGEQVTNPHFVHVEGLDEAHVAEQLVQDVRRAVYDRRCLYAHRWEPGDVVLADNYSLLHTREPYPRHLFDSRHLRRVWVTAPPHSGTAA